MFLDVYENKDKRLKCGCHNCMENADVLLELVAEEAMPLCNKHCYNTLKNLGAKPINIEVLNNK